MEKNDVIKLRDTLRKIGPSKNVPLRVFIDNSFNIIDESNKFEFTKWDDTNGFLYSFKLVHINTDTYPSNKSQSISVTAIPYEVIQVIEIAQMPLDNIDDLVTNIKSIGCDFSDDYKNLIKHVFTEIMHPDRITLTASDINSIIGPNSVNDKDDYYYNKFTENYKETRQSAEHNKKVEEG